MWLILRFFFTLAQISQMCQITTYPEHYLSKEKMLRIVISHFLGDLSQSEKPSEIKPPLLLLVADT